MSSFPEKLADRFRRFHHRHFLPKAEEYEELAAYGQSPEANVADDEQFARHGAEDRFRIDAAVAA